MKFPPRINELALKGFEERAIEAAALTAGAYFDYFPDEHLPSDPAGVQTSGARFRIPLVLPVQTPSGDNRSFKKYSLSHRDLPVALMWQPKTGTGHDGSYIVGRVDGIETDSDGQLVNAYGVFDVGPWGREAQRLVEGGFLRGISADLDNFEASIERDDDEDEFEEPDKFSEAEAETPPKPSTIKNKKILIDQARLMGITLVAKPAFQECYIMIDNEDIAPAAVPDGEYEEEASDYDSVFSTLVASAAPLIPPRDWFENPNLSQVTPLTITDDGKVFGHIASWQMNHIGYKTHQRAPRSATNYAYFKTGVLRTDDGSDVNVGQITLTGGHAPLSASAEQAARHYDDTASAMCDVTVGEDQFGIWVSGALRPDVTPEQVRAFRAAAPSGDWRPVNNRSLELVAVCAVNVPGFPVARALVAGGQIQALVAAGASAVLEAREDRISKLERRLEAMEMGNSEEPTPDISALLNPAESTLSIVEEARATMRALFAAEEPAEDLKAIAASARADVFGAPEIDMDAIRAAIYG